MADNPLEQFEITKTVDLSVAGFDLSFTNSSMWMMGILLCVSVFLIGGMSRKALVPGRWQVMVESLYELVAGMVKDGMGKEGKPYFPLVFTLFIFILAANFAGMLPIAHPFTVTSHIAITATLALFVFGFVTLLGFFKHGFGFLKLFVPSGVPGWLLPLIMIIELISFLSRPLSHSVRLFANLTAGHIMLKVFAGFVVSLGAMGGVWTAVAVFPFLFNVFLTALELLVAFLQAYVFAVLTCLYINDALHPSSQGPKSV